MVDSITKLVVLTHHPRASEETRSAPEERTSGAERVSVKTYSSADQLTFWISMSSCRRFSANASISFRSAS